MDDKVAIGRVLACMGLLFLLTAQSSPAARTPDFETGVGLFEICTSPEHESKMRCLSYVDGFIGGAIASSTADQRPRQFCPPETTTYGRFRDTIVEGLRLMPEHRDQPAHRLVLVILMRAFPCRPAFRVNDRP